jgi:hypothetical protein
VRINGHIHRCLQSDDIINGRLIRIGIVVVYFFSPDRGKSRGGFSLAYCRHGRRPGNRRCGCRASGAGSVSGILEPQPGTPQPSARSCQARSAKKPQLCHSRKMPLATWIRQSISWCCSGKEVPGNVAGVRHHGEAILTVGQKLSSSMMRGRIRFPHRTLCPRAHPFFRVARPYRGRSCKRIRLRRRTCIPGPTDLFARGGDIQ